MISRRNIRVKVMQALYAIESMEESSTPAPGVKPSADPIKLLQKQFDISRQLFVYIIHFIIEVARYAETDSRNRSNKHLPNQEDLNVNTKLAGNELLWKILESPSWKQVLKNDKGLWPDDQELVKKIYGELAEKEIYKKYIQTASREKKEEKALLDFIFTELMLPNESFESHLEEFYTSWQDDADMMVQLVNNFLSKPASYNLDDLLSKEKRQFAINLLQTALDKKEVTLDYIKPKLKNWDPDRIAVLDMILMRLGVCEFLYFETIPPKVTINEYIDLAKEYSTPQSGHFVNGILDNIHKDLVKDEKMHKVSFKPNS